MARVFPYLSEAQIERDAEALLSEFAQVRGITIAPPIPIENIVEKHLKLLLEFDDTHRLFKVPRSGSDPDILGAIYFDERRIVIDEGLDPYTNPSKEGRYRFTVAHEGGGHWRLHRHLFVTDPAQGSLFDGPAPPSFVCRSSEAKKREEWQADFYASCMLMPRKLVFAAWDDAFPDRKQRVLKPTSPVDHPFVEIDRFKLQMHGAEFARFTDTDNQALDRFAKPFAEKFRVSSSAMRIRLEKLGLLLREVPLQRILAGGG